MKKYNKDYTIGSNGLVTSETMRGGEEIRIRFKQWSSPDGRVVRWYVSRGKDDIGWVDVSNIDNYQGRTSTHNSYLYSIVKAMHEYEAEQLATAVEETEEIVEVATETIEEIVEATATATCVIEGVKEIEAAMDAVDRYFDAVERAQDDENGCCFPISRSKVSVKGLKEKYPRAAAYLHAQDYSLSAHYMQTTTGRTAMAKIKAGEDYTAVIAAMEAEWKAYTSEAMWAN